MTGRLKKITSGWLRNHVQKKSIKVKIHYLYLIGLCSHHVLMHYLQVGLTKREYFSLGCFFRLYINSVKVFFGNETFSSKKDFVKKRFRQDVFGQRFSAKKIERGIRQRRISAKFGQNDTLIAIYNNIKF